MVFLLVNSTLFKILMFKLIIYITDCSELNIGSHVPKQYSRNRKSSYKLSPY